MCSIQISTEHGKQGVEVPAIMPIRQKNFSVRVSNMPIQAGNCNTMSVRQDYGTIWHILSVSLVRNL